MTKIDWMNNFIYYSRGINYGINSKNKLEYAFRIYRLRKNIKKINYEKLVANDLIAAWNQRFCF